MVIKPICHKNATQVEFLLRLFFILEFEENFMPNKHDAQIGPGFVALSGVP